MITPKQASDFVSRARAAARQVKLVKDEIASLSDIFSAQQIATALTVDHLIGENVGLDLTEVQTAITALGAINTSLTAGSPSNLTKLLKIV